MISSFGEERGATHHYCTRAILRREAVDHPKTPIETLSSDFRTIFVISARQKYLGSRPESMLMWLKRNCSEVDFDSSTAARACWLASSSASTRPPPARRPPARACTTFFSVIYELFRSMDRPTNHQATEASNRPTGFANEMERASVMN